MGRAAKEVPGSSSGNQSGDDAAKKAAIKELNKEKDQMYNDLKSSLGQTEADAHIRVFMVSKTKSILQNLNHISLTLIERHLQKENG